MSEYSLDRWREMSKAKHSTPEVMYNHNFQACLFFLFYSWTRGGRSSEMRRGSEVVKEG